jgi:hypothetical protein
MADERPLQQPDVNTSGCWFIAPSKVAEPTADSLFWIIADMRLENGVMLPFDRSGCRAIREQGNLCCRVSDRLRPEGDYLPHRRPVGAGTRPIDPMALARAANPLKSGRLGCV